MHSELNNEIKSKLLKLYSDSYTPLKNAPFKVLIEEAKVPSSSDPMKNTVFKMVYLRDKNYLRNVEAIKTDKGLEDAFTRAMDYLSLSHQPKVDYTRGKIRESLIAIKSQSEIQLLYLEFNSIVNEGESVGDIVAYGKGDFEVLDKPEYIFNRLTSVPMSISSGSRKPTDFNDFMKPLNEFSRFGENIPVIHGMDFQTLAWEEHFFMKLRDAYFWKVYLILHEAFEKIEISEFKNMNIQYPLYVFFGEHDSPSMNVYVYDAPLSKELK